MNAEPAPDAFRLGRVLAALRRRAWIIVLCAVLGAAVALAVALSTPKKYQSTAALLFQENDLSSELFGFATTTDVDPQTEAATNLDLVTQPAIGLSTASALKVPVGRVSGTISAAAAGSSDVVNVTATDTSASFAAKLVNEYVKQFVLYRRRAEVAQVRQAIAQLQPQITRLKAAGSPKDQVSDLSTRLSQLQVLEATQTGDVQVAQQGRAPSGASSPRPKYDAALGLVAGLLVGLLAAALLERTDQSLRDVDEIRSVMDLPVLGTIPASRALARGAAPSIQGREAETFRLLRTQLRYFNVDREVRSVLITSAVPGDGKSTIAWHLALESAGVTPESRVLLLDADLRKPTVAASAGVSRAPGLTELLTHDEIDLDDVVQTVPVPGPGGTEAAKLHIITAGAEAPNPFELMESQKLKALLTRLHERFDFIVVDAPPPSVVSDAIPLMIQVSGVLVVIRIRRTRRAALRRFAEQIHELGANALGLVINDVASGRAQGYGYGYGYGYEVRKPAASARGQSSVSRPMRPD